MVRSRLESGDLNLNPHLVKQLNGDLKPVVCLSLTHLRGWLSEYYGGGESHINYPELLGRKVG